MRGHCLTCHLWVPVAVICAICGEEHCAPHIGSHVDAHHAKVYLFLAAHAAGEKNKKEAAAEQNTNG